jgi:uncharacterized membrane protein
MHIDTLEEIRKQFPEQKNINQVHRSRLSPLEKLGLNVTEHVGTMGFFFIIFGWTLLWLGWNILAPKSLRFDPYPGFVLWLFISNLIQIHLMPLIMVGQNIQARHSELRTENDYETNKKEEKAIETILLRLEHQQKLIEQLLDRVEKLEKK